MDKTESVALISGRYDPVHIGHIVTIHRLAREFDRVIVVILDYPEREYPAKYVGQIMTEVLCGSRGSFDICVNNTHFGKITREELDEWDFNVYVAGNMQVLKHIESMGYDVKWMDRAYHYEATNDRIAEGVKKLIKKH